MVRTFTSKKRILTVALSSASSMWGLSEPLQEHGCGERSKAQLMADFIFPTRTRSSQGTRLPRRREQKARMRREITRSEYSAVTSRRHGDDVRGGSNQVRSAFFQIH